MGQIHIGTIKGPRGPLQGSLSIDSNRVCYFREGGVQFNAHNREGFWESRDYLFIVMTVAPAFEIKRWNSNLQRELLNDFQNESIALLKIKETSQQDEIAPTIKRSRTYIPVDNIESMIEVRGDEYGFRTIVKLRESGLYSSSLTNHGVTAATLLKRIPKELRQTVRATRYTYVPGKRKPIIEDIKPPR